MTDKDALERAKLIFAQRGLLKPREDLPLERECPSAQNPFRGPVQPQTAEEEAAQLEAAQLQVVQEQAVQAQAAAPPTGPIGIDHDLMIQAINGTPSYNQMKQMFEDTLKGKQYSDMEIKEASDNLADDYVNGGIKKKAATPKPVPIQDQTAGVLPIGEKPPTQKPIELETHSKLTDAMVNIAKVHAELHKPPPQPIAPLQFDVAKIQADIQERERIDASIAKAHSDLCDKKKQEEEKKRIEQETEDGAKITYQIIKRELDKEYDRVTGALRNAYKSEEFKRFRKGLGTHEEFEIKLLELLKCNT